ncbi:MAG TPA: PDGLE domain-containing protein, partial [Acidimicrobiia bacterium]|nr:PDGLE domain-containing protein [Acidimicrobiia bacterium]
RRSTTTPSRKAMGGFIAAGLTLTLVLVFFVAPLASPDPDVLESVAIEQEFSETATDHAIGGPLADYGVAGAENERVGTIVAGALGVVVTFLVGLGLLLVVRRRRVV